jgi:hypothetical protein
MARSFQSRKRLIEVRNRMMGDAAQYVLRARRCAWMPLELGGGDQGVHRRGALGATIGTGE